MMCRVKSNIDDIWHACSNLQPDHLDGRDGANCVQENGLYPRKEVQVRVLTENRHVSIHSCPQLRLHSNTIDIQDLLEYNSPCRF